MTVLRSQTGRGVAMIGNTLCPLCKIRDDSQEHIGERHEIMKIAPHVKNAKPKNSI